MSCDRTIVTATIASRNREVKLFWTFSKVVRLKKYGRKKLIIARETEDLSNTPGFVLTDALHRNITRIIRTRNYRWSLARRGV